MLHLQATESLTAAIEKLLSCSPSSLNHTDAEIIRDDLSMKRVSIHTLKLIIRSQQQKEDESTSSLGDLLRGSKLKFTGFNTSSSSEPTEELQERRRYLKIRAEEREYNRMTHGSECNPQKKNVLEQEERISSYRNQFSISANMIVSTGVSCGMGYYIGDQMKFDKSTPECFYGKYIISNKKRVFLCQCLVLGLTAAIIIMLIEMILFISRSVRMEGVIQKDLSPSKVGATRVQIT